MKQNPRVMGDGNRKRLDAGICVALLLFTVSAFWPAFRADFINYDDPEYVTENPQVRAGLSLQGVQWALATGAACNWHPVTWLSHMTDVELFGLSPGGHHLTNVLLHGANTVLLFWILLRLTGARWCAGFVAGLFAVHPAHVQSVAWVSERKDVLSTFFFFLALWAYSEYARKAESKKQKAESGTTRARAQSESGENIEHRTSNAEHRLVWYLLALAFFCLGLMSKPMLVTLPFVLLLLDFWPLGRAFGRGSAVRGPWSMVRGLVLEKLPFFALSIISSWLTLHFQSAGGAVQSSVVYPFADRISNGAISYVRYLSKLIWPSDLMFFYPHPGKWPMWQVWGSLVLLAATSTVVILGAKNQRFAFVGWFWFLGTLIPVIGLVQVGAQSIADRYTYIPSIGLFILVVWGFAALAQKRAKMARAVGAVGAALLVVCAFATNAETRYWRNSASLFTHALALDPRNAVAQFSYAKVLVETNALAEAAQHLRLALELQASYTRARGELAVVLERQGKAREAIEQYREVLRVDPNSTEALNNLAWLFATYPDPTIRNGQEAVELGQRACALNPKPIFLGTLAAAYAEAGRFGEAIATAEKAQASATKWGETKIAERNAELLQVYRAGKPLKQP